MKKTALFAFNGEMMCFVHVLLYAEELDEKGYEVKLIIEGSATKLIKELNDPQSLFSKLYEAVKSKGLVDCICKACSTKMGTYDEAVIQGLRIDGEMKGHPSMEKYLSNGYTVLTF